MYDGTESFQPLARALRQLVLDEVQAGSATIDQLATSLDVPHSSIQQMLQAPLWDLVLSAHLLHSLGVSYTVERTSE